MQNRSITFFQSVVIALSVLMIAVSIRTAFTLSLFPVYPDEIAFRVLLSRIGYDFPVKTGLLAMCGQGHAWPVIWYFPAWVEWLFLGHIYQPEILRLIGIIAGGIFVVLLTILACGKNGQAQPVAKRAGLIIVTFASVLSLMGIGVIPFYLVTVRPEQWIIVFLITLLILSSIKIGTSVQKFLSIIMFFICCSLLLYAHPKAVFLTPVLFLIAFRIFSGVKKKTGILLWFLLMAMIFMNLAASVNSIASCNVSPNVSRILNSFNLDFSNMFHNPLAFFQECWESLCDYMTVVNRIGFQGLPEVSYIPPLKIDTVLNIANAFISFNCVILFFSMAICSLFFITRAVAGKAKITELLSAAIFLILLASIVINKSKHWYDAGYFWSLLVIALVTCLQGKIFRLTDSGITRTIICYVLLVGIFSQLIFIKKYEPLFKVGYQGPSVRLYGHDSESVDHTLNNLSKACHIDRDHSRNLILDDLSYLYFQKSKYPLTVTYLFLGHDGNFLRKFTRKLQIDGIVVRDFNFPAVLREKYAIEVDGIICVPRKNIIPLFDEMIPNLERGAYENDVEFTRRYNLIPRTPSDY